MTSSTAETTDSLDELVLAQLFSGAHTTNAFTDTPVKLSLIEKVYNDMRWAPTAFNSQPLRLTVIESASARKMMIDQMAEGNKAKTQAAPLIMVAAYDPLWHVHIPLLAPHKTNMLEKLEAQEPERVEIGKTNGLLQVGYLLLALRAHGLHVGPMTGVNTQGVDRIFHSENGWRTLAVINVGHAPDYNDANAQRPRAGRLDFKDAAQVK